MRNLLQLQEYWRQSKSLLYSILFVIPVWLLYEILAYRLNHGWGGQIRTGVDFFLKDLFVSAHFSGLFTIILPLLFLLIYCSREKKRGSFRRMRSGYFFIMFLECIVYGVALGVLAGSLTGLFLYPSFGETNRLMLSRLVVNIGSGPFEELVFRLGLLSGLAYLLQRAVIKKRMLALIAAVIGSSLCFSAYHYLGIFQETFATPTFVFRFFAGIIFGIIFISRGYGIAAISHSLYNTFLMFRSG